MNKTAIKNFAVWARNKLIADIEYKAGLMGITEKGIASALPQSTNEVQFFDIGTKDYAAVRGDEIRQRNSFISAIKSKERDVGYAAAFHFIVEKVAYTWFNRLIAIRFMEVNDYLPSRIRVLSSENENKAEPDMVTKPFDTDMEFSSEEEEFIMKLKDENRLDELFRWLFIKQCFKLHDVLPLLFDSDKVSGERKNGYMELLLTISFTDKDGVLWHLVHDIKERDFRILTEEDLERQKIENIPDEEMPAGQVEIIGWMYQYYNTEPKDQVFADLKKNIKISKDKIPAATQLFTPDWIVRYMVENSLGRLWVEGHPNEDLKKNWKYYLEEAEQEPEVQAQLAEFRKGYAALRPEEIKAVDPSMGSGHILVYLFDVLMQIYESQGWTQREAAQSVVQNNLYGLDIDERAAQLAYFAVMMKARQYDRRFLDRGIEPHVYEIRESNSITSDMVEYFANGDQKLKKDMETLISDLRNAKEYGSILNVTQVNFPAIYSRFDEVQEDISMYVLPVLNELLPLVKRAETMAQKYDILVTNPPYMGASGMNGHLSDFVKKYYFTNKSDIYACFIERAFQMVKATGFISMITMETWMFLASFEPLRSVVLSTKNIRNMVHMPYLGKGGTSLGISFGTAAVVYDNRRISKYKAQYCCIRYYETDKQGVPFQFPTKNERYKSTSLEEYRVIPGTPIAYWVSHEFFKAFEAPSFESMSIAEGKNVTGDNNRFLRMLWEVNSNSIGIGKHYLKYLKGGDYRKWYGNISYVIDWSKEAQDFYHKDKVSRIIPEYLWYKEGISWTYVTTGAPSFRYKPVDSTFDSGGLTIFVKDESLLNYYMGMFNSKVFVSIQKAINPTINLLYKDIRAVPMIVDNSRVENITSLVEDNITMAQTDWDARETSWEFRKHPLIRKTSLVEKAFLEWAEECEKRFERMKTNEEELNRLFINIYGLETELTAAVEDMEISVRKADITFDICSLISYAVGCMFGRYSLDVDGLVYAGGAWDSSKYTTFIPDPDNCIPITDEPYFEDDIVGRFVDFVRIVYGEKTLEDNLSFIANALGNKGNSSREVIRNYFLNDFFKDHCSIYSVTGSGKRPIYWLFDSGKQNGFKALVYMHRWNADTVGNLRVEYLHKMQRVYEKEIERMQDIIENGSNNREINQATKRREKLVKQLKEARDYDAKIAHAALSRVEIDLDDGVKVNYEKVQKGPDGKSLGILAKI